MKIAGFTALGGACLYLAAGEEGDLRHDAESLRFVFRVLDGTPFETANRPVEIPVLASFDAELAAAGLTPVSLAPPAATPQP